MFESSIAFWFTNTVTARVLEHDGILGGRLTARDASDPSTLPRGPNPTFLVPAAPLDPDSGLALFGGVSHRLHDLLPAAGRPELEPHLRVADPHEVPVALDEPRNRQRSREVDHPRRGADERLDFLIAPHGHENAAARGERPRFGPGVIDGHDLSVAEHQVRGRLRVRERGEQDESETGERAGHETS
jgi:hypothetical protein